MHASMLPIMILKFNLYAKLKTSLA